MTGSKARRHRAIVESIGSRPIRTQDELSDALAANGIRVSQATLSRDVHELGLVKAADGYSVPETPGSAVLAERELARIAAQLLVEARTAQHLVVLRTVPGGANAVAQSLDAAEWPDIVGTIAGDDTIFVATADASAARRVRERLDAL